MISVGVIGTSLITEQFIEAARDSGLYEVNAIYSRTDEKGRTFSEKWNIPSFYTSLVDFLATEIEVVYVASPNAAHFEQVLSCLEAGKHVIVEKTIFTHMGEWEQAHSKAQEKGLFIFEGARHVHDQNFRSVKEWVRQHKIDGASLNFCKYSSKYDQYLAGELPNVFSKECSAGALMDLGVYPVYTAIAWFGKPDSVEYFARFFKGGADKCGQMLLRYADFDVSILVGKNMNCDQSSEIYSGRTTLSLDKIEWIHSIQEWQNHQLKTNFAQPASSLELVDEVTDFARILTNPDGLQEKEDYEQWTRWSREVLETLQAMRKKANIVFPSDPNE